MYKNPAKVTKPQAHETKKRKFPYKDLRNLKYSRQKKSHVLRGDKK
jgi:hypothetical protein